MFIFKSLHDAFEVELISSFKFCFHNNPMLIGCIGLRKKNNLWKVTGQFLSTFFCPEAALHISGPLWLPLYPAVDQTSLGSSPVTFTITLAFWVICFLSVFQWCCTKPIPKGVSSQSLSVGLFWLFLTFLLAGSNEIHVCHWFLLHCLNGNV